MSRLIALLAVLLFFAGCSRPVTRTSEVVAVQATKLPLDPADPAWTNAPEHLAKLMPQDLVEPRLMHASTPEVLVRSLTNGVDIAFRLEWADAAVNDLPGPGRFLDACAIQIPRKIEPNAPDPQMGQTARTVEVTNLASGLAGVR